MNSFGHQGIGLILDGLRISMNYYHFFCLNSLQFYYFF
jgi:hypothetical protein